MSDNKYVKILTPEFIVAFPCLYKPTRVETDDPLKYRITMLFEKDADLSELKETIEAVAEKEFGKDWKKIKNFRNPLQDGDSSQCNGFAGRLFARSSTLHKPKVLDQQKGLIPEENAEMIYPGSKARAVILVGAFTYKKMSKGVTLQLAGVQKTGDGERLDMGYDCTDDFEAIEADESDEDMLA